MILREGMEKGEGGKITAAKKMDSIARR